MSILRSLFFHRNLTILLSPFRNQFAAMPSGRSWTSRRGTRTSQRSVPASSNRISLTRFSRTPTTPISRRQRPFRTPSLSARSQPNESRSRSVPISELSTIPEAHGAQAAPEIDEDADFLQEIVMAVNMREKGTVGCSYYVAQQETMYLMEDCPLGNVAMVESCTSSVKVLY